MKNSQFSVQLVIIFLGLNTLATVIGGIILSLQEKSLPDALIGLGGTALGALGALLARTGTSTESVRVVNEDDDPVPVDAGSYDLTMVLIFTIGLILGWMLCRLGVG